MISIADILRITAKIFSLPTAQESILKRTKAQKRIPRLRLRIYMNNDGFGLSADLSK
jgi:hypothetical protein